MKQQISLVSIEYRKALLEALHKYNTRFGGGGRVSRMRASDLRALVIIIRDKKYIRNSELTDAVKKYIDHELKTGFLLFDVEGWLINTGMSWLKQLIKKALKDNPATKLAEYEINLLVGLLESTEGFEKETLREELAKSQQEYARAQEELTIMKREQWRMEIEMMEMRRLNSDLTSKLREAVGKIGGLERRLRVVEQESMAEVDKLSLQTEELLVKRQESECFYESRAGTFFRSK